jgi:hypothetical protein
MLLFIEGSFIRQELVKLITGQHIWSENTRSWQNFPVGKICREDKFDEDYTHTLGGYLLQLSTNTQRFNLSRCEFQWKNYSTLWHRRHIQHLGSWRTTRIPFNVASSLQRFCCDAIFVWFVTKIHFVYNKSMPFSSDFSVNEQFFVKTHFDWYKQVRSYNKVCFQVWSHNGLISKLWTFDTRPRSLSWLAQSTITLHIEEQQEITKIVSTFFKSFISISLLT